MLCNVRFVHRFECAPSPTVHLSGVAQELALSFGQPETWQCTCRGHEKGECAASECTLLCNDFQRLGYNKIIVDPSVRLAYTYKDALDAHNAKFIKGIRMTDWADIQSSPGIDWSLTPHRPYSK